MITTTPVFFLFCPQVYPEKIQTIVSQISQLTLVEVAELNALLKTTLNIPDAPVMAFGAAPVNAAAQVWDRECLVQYLE